MSVKLNNKGEGICLVFLVNQVLVEIDKQRKYFKLKDGEQVYRILPAMGELKETRQWSIFHSVHYGYKSTDGKQKPFLSCEVKNRNNGMVDVADAAKDRLTSLKESLKKRRRLAIKRLLINSILW